MIINDFLLSLIVFPVLVLITILARRVLLKLYSSFARIKLETQTTSRSAQRRKEIIYGRIGVGVALLGFYLTVVFLWSFLDHQSNVLDNAAMEEWEDGSGWIYVHFCERIIVLFQIIAVGFGVLSRRTAFGPVVFVIVAALTYMAFFRLPQWYWWFTRWT